MWRRWDEHPPQLGSALIRIRIDGFEWMGTAQEESWFAKMIGGLEWASTGIYREQYFEDTGIWA